MFTEVWGYDGFISGQYRPTGSQGRPKLEFWLKQLSIYLVAIVVMKLVVTGLLALFPFLIFVAKTLIGLFGDHGNAQGEQNHWHEMRLCFS